MANLPTELGEDQVKNACKPGGPECCRYLTMGGGGITSMACAKGSVLQPTIDQRADTMKAKGDNCSGPPNFEPPSNDEDFVLEIKGGGNPQDN